MQKQVYHMCTKYEILLHWCFFSSTQDLIIHNNSKPITCMQSSKHNLANTGLEETRERLCVGCIRVSQCHHHWHSGLNNPLLVDYLGHSRMLSRILGASLLDARSASPVVKMKHVSRHSQLSSGRQDLLRITELNLMMGRTWEASPQVSEHVTWGKFPKPSFLVSSFLSSVFYDVSWGSWENPVRWFMQKIENHI